ncbi:MAG: YetF domain-containing protein [Phycisphaerales bacterium]
MTVTMGVMLFDSWGDIGRVLVAAPILYFTVILCVRLTGKRSTSQMNNFDWIISVAIGSIIASPIMIEDVSVAEGAAAVGLLFILQWIVTKLVYHSEPIQRTVRARPTILLYRGQMQHNAMRRERVTEEEVISAIRESGKVEPSQVGMVVLESDAKLSVIPMEALEGHEGEEEIGGLRIAKNAKNER